jgi:SAM-dependent methyltransferase
MSWYDDDAMWAATESWMFDPARWEGTAAEVDGVVDLLGAAPPARVLDLCCGPGRHSIELARRGYVVTGVDRTEYFLAAAERRAREAGLEVEWVESDMREFSRPETFDCVVNLLTSFGYFEDRNDDRRVVQNIFESLKSGGKVVLDLMGKENLARIFQPREWQEKDNGEIWLFERTLDQSWSWMSNRWIRYKGDQRVEFQISHRLYSAFELTSLFEDCGFSQVDTFGSLAGAPYDQEAKRLVLVAAK